MLMVSSDLIWKVFVCQLKQYGLYVKSMKKRGRVS